MARFGIVTGLLLCIDTAFALFGSLNKAPLMFIPMMLGIPILFFGVVALNPHRRRQALATAAGVAALGVLVGLGHLAHFIGIWRDAGAVNLHTTRVVSGMVAVCLTFSVGYLWSLGISARSRARRPVESVSNVKSS